MLNVVYAVDISISMEKPYGDFVPNKLIASLETIAVGMKRIIGNNGRVGLTVFAGYASPVLPLTDDLGKITSTLGVISRTHEGSAPGDAIVESNKLLRNVRLGKKRIIVISDGELNAGIPLEYAVLYAKNTGTEVYYITIGAIQQVKIRELLNRLSQRNLITWIHASSKKEFISQIIKLART